MTWSLVAMIVTLALAAVLVAVLVAGIRQYGKSEEHKRELELLKHERDLHKLKNGSDDEPPY